MNGARLLGLVVAGCASSSAAPEPPHTEVLIEEALPESTLPGLGITERVTGPKSAERAVRRVSPRVGACAKAAVEREPGLRGTMTFRLEPGQPVEVKPGGTLAALSAASCIEDALRGAKVTDADGAFDYTLTFGGAYTPTPIRDGVALSDVLASVDWSSPAGEGPAALTQSYEALRDRIRRCAFGAEPFLSENLWLVARVGKGGGLTLGATESSDAADCIQRVVKTASFPTAGHDYAISMLLRPIVQLPLSPRSPEPEGERQQFGIMGLLSADAAVDRPTGLWGSDDSLDGFDAGDIGLIGRGGGGAGVGGLGIGTFEPGRGTGTGTVSGNGSGRLGGSHKAPPRIRMGSSKVSGRLPPEVIQRIVRQKFGRFRFCYESALQKAPTLTGEITVAFEIDPSGSTKKVSSKSTIKDKAMVSCVEKAFAGLSFPKPNWGVVKVSYPIRFSPAADSLDSSSGKPAAPTPAAPPPQSIGGKPIASVSMLDIEERSLAHHYLVTGVPGFRNGETPALFLTKPGFGLFTVTLGADDKSLSGEVCTAGTDDRRLYIRGEGCDSVLRRLLD